MPRRTGPNAVIAGALLAGVATPLPAQRCPAGAHPVRLAAIAGGFAATEVAVVAIRAGDWWTTPDTTFHFTSGGSASAGQDLLLHGFIAYHTAQLGRLLFDWACVSHTAAGWLGAGLGLAVGLPKEIGDGLHAEKGFALDDFAVSAAGALLPALHQAVPVTRAVQVKAWYWPSAELRNRPPGSLPSLENDYAGQRYYVALQPGAAPGGAAWWPDWLGLALGHGVPHWATAPPSHDWYGVLDLRLSGLPLRGEVWRRVASVLDQVHIPAPGIRVRDGAVRVGLF
jgi:hypothetical protein